MTKTEVDKLITVINKTTTAAVAERMTELKRELAFHVREEVAKYFFDASRQHLRELLQKELDKQLSVSILVNGVPLQEGQ